MPSVSKAQQAFMGHCLRNTSNKPAKCPPKSVAREYASTPRKGLPERKSKK